MRLSERQKEIIKNIGRGEQPGYHLGYYSHYLGSCYQIDPATDGQALKSLLGHGLIFKAKTGEYLLEDEGRRHLQKLQTPDLGGRPRKYNSNAERQRAFRAREKARNAPRDDRDIDGPKYRQMTIEQVHPPKDWLTL